MTNGPVVISHFVVKIKIEQVVHTAEPAQGRGVQKMERTVEEVVRIVTKADQIGTAIVKAKKYLAVEREDIGGDSIPNYLVGEAVENER